LPHDPWGGKDFPYNAAQDSAMITSKLTSKAQTTIPQPVRAALRLAEGDEIAYEIEGSRVVLTKLVERGIEDPFAAFSEWDSPADRKAYAKL
jgi:antitoxin PrlF